MTTEALPDSIIYTFREVFGRAHLMHFSAYIWGSLLCTGRHTISNVYLAGAPSSSYWALVKFISRARWEPLAVSRHLVGLILLYVPQWVYVYDHTHAIKTGTKQARLHFFRNHRYRKRNTNQSKFHWGHQFAALGLLARLSPNVSVLFPVWVKLLAPGATAALEAFRTVLSILPPGLILFDRGFNNRKYFKQLLEDGFHLLCRARKNAVFYALPTVGQQPRRGRRVYGRRLSIPHLRFADRPIPALNKTVSLAHQIVRTKMCPQPVHLVVIRTKPKPNKPYRYFLVFTTDLSLSVETIVRYYQWRWKLETAFRDTKENLGFDHYQVRADHSIERTVLLSCVAASIARLAALPAFQRQHQTHLPTIGQALKQMNIHWYHPTRWTLGLILKYLRGRHTAAGITPGFSSNENQENFTTYRLAAG